ncbi:MAG: T9SS type A sorting domain-containing protein, partial [Bacteroidales bacterium]|nr:T9SS type A sorting domain-containing protein [Bacteroidales bacterium]
SWTGGEETAWNIKISTEEITDFTGIIPDAQNLSSATYSAGSLNSQTPYYVYVQAICDVDDLSEWSYAGIFTTLCGTFSLPLAEGFNTSGSSVFPDCWTQQNVSGTANITFETTQYHEGTRSVRFPYTSSSQTRLVSPSISIENISSVDLEFWWYHNSSGGSTSYQNEGVQVQYSFDGETWTDIGDFIKRYAETSGWEKKEIIIPSLNENDVLYIGFLAYGRGSYYYAYMDELKISESPSCYPPLVISASAITSNSADISWTPRGEEAEWNIIISETAITDFTNEDIDIPNHGSTTYSLSVLDVQTPYYVYVQAICDVNDLSTWSEYSFSTLAAPANLPYECAFDNDSENSAWNLLSHSGKTDKWYIGNTTSGTYTVTNGLYVSGNNGASNTYSSADTYIYAFRELNLEDIGTYRIKFDWRCYGENEGFAYDYVRAFLVPQDITVEGGNIYGMTENSNVSTPSGWIDVSGVLKWKNTIQELEREIPVYQNGIYKLAFLWKTDGGVNNNPPASIYNISVEFIECAAPINFAASDITNSSATISWNEGELSAWNIILSETAISNFDDEVPTVSNHTSTSYSLSELAENTTYYVYIQGICEDDEVTGWSGTSFTTERLCGIVENITIPTITVTENSATISWTEGFANIGTYDIIISTSEITDFSDITPTESNISGTSYNATGLPHNTRHYVYIRANCSNDVLSTWVGSSFMTKCGDLITSYPYFEGFNDAALSECWTELNEDNGSQRWTPSTTQKYEGDRSIFVRYESSSLTNNDWLISPKFQVQEGLNMEFWARAYSSTWSEDFNILVSKTGTATADFNITLQSVTNHGATWTKFDYQLDAITGINIGDEIYFAIQYVSTNKYGLYVDAFRVYVPSSENDILTFSVANQIGESVIDTENHTVYAEIHYGESLTTLAPAITISDYATISPASGTARDFTTPVIYTVTSESGVAQEWTVTVVNASTPSSENDILSFDFPGRMGNVDIDTDNHTVTAQLRFDFDITVITPVFTVSNYATATPASGTVQDFSAPFVYAVEAQDESVQNWTVNITHAPVPVGGNCSNPVVVDFASDIPYNVTEQTTCGYGNLGEVIGCANGGGNGEDVVYRLDVDVPVYATFTLDPKGTANSTMTVHNSCDSYSGFLFCSWSNGGSIEYSHVIYPGSYYMIININTNNGCIPDYDFSITVETDACLSISNMEINDLTQNTATVSWTNGFIETSWDIKYGQQGFDPGTGGTLISGVTTNPYTITGLNENVRYDVYVKPACETNWSTNTTFRTLANCPMPVDVTVSNITQDEAEINWNGYNATAWDIIISESMLLDPDTYPNPLNVTTTAHQAQSLDAGTIYYVYVRANCGSDEYSYWTYVTEFITLQEPSAIPFTSDFESPQENANWTILNGDQNNRWYIGNAVNNGGASSLYISNNEGVSNSYLTNMTSYVYAYRTLDIQTTDLLVIDFDYKVNGENNNDVLNVYLIPQDVELSAGNAYGMTGSVNTPPASWIKVNESPLSSQTTWADFYETITVPTTGTYNLVFFWKNNATSGSQSPAAIDNIVVRVASNENDILSFEMDEQTQPAVIDATAHTVSLEVEYNVSLTSLVPAITISDYASISPASGTAQDFTNPVTYTVTAENGDDQDWIVTVVNAPSPENDILSFSMTEELCEATIDADAKTIIIGVAGGTDVTSLIPTITISDLASISPASGVAQDFTNPVSYTVTAENGDEAEWTITVSVISLTCPEDITVATGTTQEFSGYSPLGGTFSGEGVSGNSFDATSLAREDYDVTYTYIDEETGCEQSCDFTVTVASGENNIITFYVAEQLCGSRIDADAKTIVIGVPHDTDVTSLTPVATISEYATMSPASGIVQDFTNPVTYNVTAESGDIQAWTVTVIELPEITCPDDMDLTIGTIANFEGYSPADGIFSGQGLETAISGNTINTTGLSSNIYAVTYTYTEPQTGCEISCNFNINIHVGIVSNEVAAISVYPNPNSGNFFIELDGINGLATYQIVDTKGSLLHQETISVNNDSIEEVSVNLVPGIYYVKIITDTQTIIEKITVQ